VQSLVRPFPRSDLLAQVLNGLPLGCRSFLQLISLLAEFLLLMQSRVPTNPGLMEIT